MDIRIENLTKKYGGQRAVDDISFEVKTGEILGFLGPNGAGKTTTVRMITNFILPNEGTITIGGKDMRNFPDEIKRHIGYLPENNPLYHDMPVIDYLEQHEDVMQMYTDIQNFLANWIPRFEAENRSYMTIALGCTGGYHRSVYLGERLGKYLREQHKNIIVRHRELT